LSFNDAQIDFNDTQFESLRELSKNKSQLSFPEISVNSSSVTMGNNYKLLNQTFTTTYGIYTEDTGLYAGPGL